MKKIFMLVIAFIFVCSYSIAAPAKRTNTKSNIELNIESDNEETKQKKETIRKDFQEQYQLAEKYYKNNASGDYKRAAELYKSIVQQYIEELIYESGKDYASFYGRTEEAKKAAFMWEKNVGLQNDKSYYYYIGCRYFDGEGTKKDYKKAFKYYKKAVSAGIKLAKYQLGTMYYYGLGVEKNEETAFKYYDEVRDWMKLQASDSSSYSTSEPYTFYIGNIYFYKKAYTDAVKWYKNFIKTILNSGTNSFAIAQYRLGDFYYNGYGTEQNYKEAAKMYRETVNTLNIFPDNKKNKKENYKNFEEKRIISYDEYGNEEIHELRK